MCAPPGPSHAAQIGPRPTKPPGVIVKYKSPRGAQPAIAGARPGGSGGMPSQALDPELNLYRVQVPAGQTAAQAAAALARSSGAKCRGVAAFGEVAGWDGTCMPGMTGEDRPAQDIVAAVWAVPDAAAAAVTSAASRVGHPRHEQSCRCLVLSRSLLSPCTRPRLFL